MTRQRHHRPAVRTVLALLTAAALASGCGETPATSASPAGTGLATASPSGQPTAAAGSAAIATPSTPPTPLPAAVEARWVPAGETVHSYHWDAQLLALPDGGALLLASPLDDEGIPVDGVLSAERWDPLSGWREVASTTGRDGYAAVALPDGRVLIAGGATAERESMATAAVYDPATDGWTDMAPMSQPRTSPAAALLPDGRVLVIGGFVWASDREAAGLPGAHVGARLRTGDAVDGGRVQLLDVAVPPFGPALATAEIFDPATGAWESAPPMRFARSRPAITALASGQVLVAGSSLNTRVDARAYDTAEVYDPATGRFTRAGTLPNIDRELIARRGVALPEGPAEYGAAGTLAPLPDGGAILVGREVSWKHEGEVVWSARLASDLAGWRAVGEPFAQRDIHDDGGFGRQQTGVSRLDAVVLALWDGTVLVAGGSPGYSMVTQEPVSVVRYDSASDTWAPDTDLPEPRSQPLGVSLTGRSVLLAAGRHEVASGDGAATEWAAESYRLLPQSFPIG